MRPTRLWQLERILEWTGGDKEAIFRGTEWETAAFSSDAGREVPSEMVIFAAERTSQQKVYRHGDGYCAQRIDDSDEEIDLADVARSHGGDFLEQMFEGGNPLTPRT